MTDDHDKPEHEPERKPVKPIPKRGDLQRLMRKVTKQPAKQRQAPAKPPPQRHQRRGR